MNNIMYRRVSVSTLCSTVFMWIRDACHVLIASSFQRHHRCHVYRWCCISEYLQSVCIFTTLACLCRQYCSRWV